MSNWSLFSCDTFREIFFNSHFVFQVYFWLVNYSSFFRESWILEACSQWKIWLFNDINLTFFRSFFPVFLVWFATLSFITVQIFVEFSIQSFKRRNIRHDAEKSDISQTFKRSNFILDLFFSEYFRVFIVCIWLVCKLGLTSNHHNINGKSWWDFQLFLFRFLKCISLVFKVLLYI